MKMVFLWNSVEQVKIQPLSLDFLQFFCSNVACMCQQEHQNMQLSETATQYTGDR